MNVFPSLPRGRIHSFSLLSRGEGKTVFHARPRGRISCVPSSPRGRMNIFPSLPRGRISCVPSSPRGGTTVFQALPRGRMVLFVPPPGWKVQLYQSPPRGKDRICLVLSPGKRRTKPQKRQKSVAWKSGRAWETQVVVGPLFPKPRRSRGLGKCGPTTT